MLLKLLTIHVVLLYFFAMVAITSIGMFPAGSAKPTQALLLVMTELGLGVGLMIMAVRHPARSPAA